MFIFFLTASLPLAGNSGRLTWVRHNSCKSSATHSYQCVQYFCVSEQWYVCQCLGFLTCTQMLMHAITHRGCTHTVRLVCIGSWLWEKKNPLPHWGLEPMSVLRLTFQSNALPTELSLPLVWQYYCTTYKAGSALNIQPVSLHTSVFRQIRCSPPRIHLPWMSDEIFVSVFWTAEFCHLRTHWRWPEAGSRELVSLCEGESGHKVHSALTLGPKEPQLLLHTAFTMVTPHAVRMA